MNRTELDELAMTAKNDKGKFRLLLDYIKLKKKMQSIFQYP